MIIKNFSENHHAFLISLDGQATQTEVVNNLEKNFPTFFREKTISKRYFLSESFSIDSAREVKAAQESRNEQNERRLIIIGFSSITREAQNALLKVFEEPTFGTHFFILAPNQSLLLETVRSRCVDLEICRDENNTQETHGSFLAQTPKERLVIIKNLLEEKSAIGTFFHNLELEISALENKERFSRKSLRTLFAKSKYYSQSGNSAAKYLLEELALVLPTVRTK